MTRTKQLTQHADASSVTGNNLSDHRLTLTRSWNPDGGSLCIVMLNPSTATDETDDPTIRKCTGFAKRWGFGKFTVVNLCTWRATKPIALFARLAAQMDCNLDAANEVLVDTASGADMVLAAWGSHGRNRLIAPRVQHVTETLLSHVDLYCIGKTKDGQPLHPCMAAYTDAPVLWRAML